MGILQQSTATVKTYKLGTGLTTVTLAGISKNGGAFAAPSDGTVTSLSNGWYKVALDSTDTNTLGDLALRFVAVAGTPTDPPADQVGLVVDLSGNVNGNVNGNVEGNVEGNVGGDVLGNLPALTNGTMAMSLVSFATNNPSGPGMSNTGSDYGQYNDGSSIGQLNNGDTGQYNNGSDYGQYNTGDYYGQRNTGDTGQYNEGSNAGQINTGTYGQYNTGSVTGQRNTGSNNGQYNDGSFYGQYNGGTIGQNNYGSVTGQNNIGDAYGQSNTGTTTGQRNYGSESIRLNGPISGNGFNFAPAVAAAAFIVPFTMRTTAGALATGKTVTGVRLVSGGSPEAVIGTITELAGGGYQLSTDNGATNDLANSGANVFMFTATGCEPTFVTVYCQPA